MHIPPMAKGKSVIPIERIATRIYLIRGQKVMLDRDLATLYQVRPTALRQQVKRIADRFPADFMFQLNEREIKELLSQNVIPRRYLLGGSMPYAFTEQGVAMLSAVLRSKRAVEVSLAIMRTFVRLREILATHKDLARKVEEHDRKITLLIEAVQKILAPQSPSKKNPIGYVPPKD